MHNIAIAIITYKRSNSLDKCIATLKKIKLPENSEVFLCIVDNDHEKSAKPVFDKYENSFPFKIIYSNEEKKGIPYARNKALELCSKADFIAFTDDDDMVEETWLLNLYETLIKYKADVVQGAIKYRFQSGYEHLRNIDIFAELPFETGTEIDFAWTNNVIFSTSIYNKLGLKFDSTFTKIGGSDSHFFKLAHSNSKKIVFCKEAVVNSVVSIRRSSWKWIALRNMRIGANITISDILINGFYFSFKQLLKSSYDSIKYFFRLLPGVFKGHNKIIYPAMVLVFIFGRIIGIFKISPKEYR